jgi:hypothetical protein
VGDRRSAGRRLARAVAPGASPAARHETAPAATPGAGGAPDVGAVGVVVTMAEVGEAPRR